MQVFASPRCSGRMLGSYGQGRAVYAVAVGELDGRPVIVSDDSEGTVRVWELADGTPLGDPLTGRHHAVRAVAVGELDEHSVIVSGGDDRTVRVWEPRERKALVIVVDSAVVSVMLDKLGRVLVGANAGILLLEPRRAAR
jgi:WD40 repeat protein